jgi:hypothetical protein
VAVLLHGGYWQTQFGKLVCRPLARSQDYVRRCRAAGADVTHVAPEGEGHRDPIDPSSATWRAAVEWLDGVRAGWEAGGAVEGVRGGS